MTAEIDDEIIALREIFQRDFESLPPGPWNTRRFAIVARVLSSTHSHNYGSARLQFEIPLKYPKVAPTVKTVFSDGIIERDRVTIMSRISLFCRSHEGDIICYDLIQLVQELLLQIGPLKQPRSLHEVMQERERDNITESLLGVGVELDLPVPGDRGLSPPPIEPLQAPNEWVDNAWLTQFLQEERDTSLSEGPDHLDNMQQSRYFRDFIEVSVLGRGASGEVCKCRHRLDERFYAIKKIKITKDQATLFKEVKFISSLVHSNIVRYYSAWIENHIPDENDDSGEDSRATARIPNRDSFILVSASSASDGLLTGEEEVANDDSLWRPLDQFSDTDFIQTNEVSHIESSEPLQLDLDEIELENEYLYIQMEYCTTTLKALIGQAALCERPSEVFNLLRQILEALAYIHSRGVIHRDLKPANIFLDAEGSIRIGDFGLATHSWGASAFSETSAPSFEDASLTRGVGTYLYIPPEFEHLDSSRRTHGAKADMYSLGIILFEMVHPRFKTGMERVQDILYLRQHSKLPLGFVAQNENLGRLVEHLVSTDPNLRPTAAELLESPLLPLRIGLDRVYLREVTNALVNKEVSQEIVTALFRRTHRQPNSTSYDSRLLGHLAKQINGRQRANAPGVDKSGYSVSSSVRKQCIREHFRRTCQLFGAVDFTGALLRECGGGTESGTFAQLLEECGQVVSLPVNLLAGFGRAAGLLEIENSIHYSVGDVYHPPISKDVAFGHPLPFSEACFDIISDSSPSASVFTSVLSFLSTFLDAVLVEDSTQICIRYCNETLSDAILDLCGIRPVEFKAAAKINIDNLIELGVSPESIDNLREFFCVFRNQKSIHPSLVTESLLKVYEALDLVIQTKRLRADCKDEMHRLTRRAMKQFEENLLEMKFITKFLEEANISIPIYLDFEIRRESVCIHSNVFRNDSCFIKSGLYMVVYGRTRRTDSFVSFAEVGHFETLYYKNRPPATSSKQISAVGIRLSIEKLSNISIPNFARYGFLDVMIFVASNVSSHTVSKLQHVLRSSNFKTVAMLNQLMHLDTTSDNDGFCLHHHIPYLIKVLTDSKFVIRFILTHNSDVSVASIDEVKATLIHDKVLSRKNEITDSNQPIQKCMFFADRNNVSFKDRVISKLVSSIEDNIRRVISLGITKQQFTVIVSDLVSLIEIRDYVSCVLRLKAGILDSHGLGLFIESKDSTRRGLQNIHTAILTKSRPVRADECLCIIYSLQDDSFDSMRVTLSDFDVLSGQKSSKLAAHGSNSVGLPTCGKQNLITSRNKHA